MVEIDETNSWLARLQQGQADALAELFEHHRPRLRRMVQMRMDPRAAGRVDPSDVLQEAYLDAAEGVQRYAENPTVSSYVWLRGLTWERLMRILRRHLGAKCRTAQRECPLPSESSIFLAKQLLAGQSTPSKALRREELQHRVQGALQALDAVDREVILMRHFEDMSNREIAEALQLSDSGASMRYGRAVFRLKQLLMTDSAEQVPEP